MLQSLVLLLVLVIASVSAFHAPGMDNTYFFSTKYSLDLL